MSTAAKKACTMHVISHTHWDREWRYSFQQFRIMLVQMMDHMLTLLDEYPEYKCFHLDSQTIALDDYFEVKPEKRDAVRARVSSGRLNIGPWYILPDPSAVSGESLVRNLLIGTTATRALGGKNVSGYSPFGFGQVSQTPQLYRGFGLDHIFFYRGNNKQETRSEFTWEGPDGSRLLGFRVAEIFGRANFWVNVYRPAVLGKFPFDWTYTWKERQLPYHECDTSSYLRFDYYLLENADPHTYYPENLEKGLATLREQSMAHATTSQLVCLDGHDQSEPHPRVMQIVADANRLTGDRYLQSTFTDYVKAMKAESGDLQVKHGEFRYPNIDGMWLNLYYGVLGARMYLKLNNREAENALHGQCEPLCTLAWLLGAEYPAGLLNIAWRHLLMNQGHDSIAGCSIDKVHEDCEYRTRQVTEIAGTLGMMSLGGLIQHVNAGHLPEDAILLTIFNPLMHERQEVCQAAVDIPADMKSNSIRLFDDGGVEVPVHVIREEPFNVTVKIPREFPLPYAVKRYHIRFATGSVPALGYKTFHVRPEAGKRRNRGSLLTGPRSMANEHLAVAINPDGTLTVTEKAGGRTYCDLHYFEDSSDVGDPWTRKTVQQERLVTTLGTPARISCLEDGALSAQFLVVMPLTIPKAALPDSTRRGDDEVTLEITSLITLNKGSRRVEIETSFTNSARDHRLRAMFPTDLVTDLSWADSPFDVVSRAIRVPDDSTWKERQPTVHPQLDFCDLSDGQAGFALLNRGLLEYEAVDDARRTLALTLMRTYRFPMIGADPDVTTEHPSEKGGQCLRDFTVRYALCPHEGDWEAGDVAAQARDFNLPLRVALHGRPSGTLPMQASLLAVNDRRVMLSAVKKAEARDSVVLRLCNPTAHVITATLRSLLPIAEAHRLNLEETREVALPVAGGHEVALAFPPKVILTVELVPGS